MPMIQLIQDNRKDVIDWPTSTWLFGHGENPITRKNNYEGLASDLAVYQKALRPEEVQRVMSGDFSFEK